MTPHKARFVAGVYDDTKLSRPARLSHSASRLWPCMRAHANTGGIAPPATATNVELADRAVPRESNKLTTEHQLQNSRRRNWQMVSICKIQHVMRT